MEKLIDGKTEQQAREDLKRAAEILRQYAIRIVRKDENKSEEN